MKYSKDKMLKLVNSVTRNRRLCYKLRSIGAKKLVGHTKTRWYSLTNAITALLEVKPHLKILLDEENPLVSKISDLILDVDFWKEIEEYRMYLEKLSSYIAIAESRDSRLSESFRSILDFAKFLESELGLRKVATRMVYEAFLYHYHKLDLEVLLVAYILDPMYKMEYLTKEGIKLASSDLLAQLFGNNYEQKYVTTFAQDFKDYMVDLKTNRQ